MDHPPDTTSLLHHFAALKDLRQRVKVIYPLPAAAPMARWNASTPSWAPQSSHRATSRSCRCRRNSSPHRTARRRQDCERNAAKRWLARHGHSVAHLRPIFLGDDLFAYQPIAAAIQQNGGNLGPRRGPSLACKPSSHQTNTEYLHGAKLEEHRQTVRKGRQCTTTNLPLTLRRAAAGHRRRHPGQLVLHRDLQCRRQAHLLQQLRHRSAGHRRDRRRTGRLRAGTLEDRE